MSAVIVSYLSETFTTFPDNPSERVYDVNGRLERPEEINNCARIVVPFLALLCQAGSTFTHHILERIQSHFTILASRCHTGVAEGHASNGTQVSREALLAFA